jgi:hypothetical protein
MEGKSALWIGWHRPLGSRIWTAACGATTEERCWSRLFAVQESGDKVVLESPRRPWEKDKQRELF